MTPLSQCKCDQPSLPPMCSQESASAWARPWPEWNSSSTWPPSFRTSPYAHWCHLLTSISLPRSQALATFPQPMSSAWWPADCPSAGYGRNHWKTELCPSVQGHPPPSPKIMSTTLRKGAIITGHRSARVTWQYVVWIGSISSTPVEKPCPVWYFSKNLQIVPSPLARFVSCIKFLL